MDRKCVSDTNTACLVRSGRWLFRPLGLALCCYLALFAPGCVDTAESPRLAEDLLVAGDRISRRPDHLGQEEPSVNIVKPERWQLANGLVVLYQHDDEVPLVRGGLYLRAGAFLDPPDKVGLAAAVAAQRREGGIAGYTPERFHKHLDDLAVTVESAAENEFAKVGFSSLAENFTEAFELFAKVVREPAFDQDQLTLWRKLALEGIARRRDDPGAIAAMAFGDLVFGAGSPYSRDASPESVLQITRQDLLRFQSESVGPTGALLAISGAVPKELVQAAVERHFGSWQPQQGKLVAPPITDEIVPGIYVLERDFQQATVFIGHRGPARLSPDMFTIALFNQLFGQGGFDSLLFNEVRTKLGLAYAVDGGFEPGLGVGLFEISLGTRNEEATNAIKRVIELLSAVRTDRFDPMQVSKAKSAVKRRFVFNFASTEGLITRAALTEILGFPKDHDRNYLRNVERVSGEDLHRVAREKLDLKQLVIVVVGGVKAEEIAKSFAGEMNTYRLKFDTKPSVLDQVILGEGKDNV